MSNELAGAGLQVEVGKDDWLFISAYGNLQLISSQGDLANWTQSHLSILTEQFVGRQDYLHGLGITYIVAIAPEKSVVYPEYLTSGKTIARPSAAEILTTACSDAGIQSVDLTSPLIAAKGALDVYAAADSHWNYFGGYLAYRAIMKAIQESAPEIGRLVEPTDIFYQEKRGYCDLSVQVAPERLGIIQTVRTTSQAEEVLHAFDERERTLTIHRSARGRGRVMIFRDSFATFLGPYISNTFAETIYVSQAAPLLDDLVEEMKPDVVIQECSERALFYNPLSLQDIVPYSWRQIFLEAHDHPRHKSQIRQLRTALAECCYENAVAQARQLSAEYPTEELDHRLAEALLGAKACEEALQVCLKMEEHRAKNPYVSYLKTWAMRALGNKEEALASIRDALAVSPRNSCFLNLHGIALLEAGNTEEAITQFQAVLRRCPDNIRAWRDLSYALTLKDDLSGATAAQQQADRLEGCQTRSAKPN